MKTTNMLLIILGILIFFVSLLGGGLLFKLPIPGIFLSIFWVLGIILVVLGLELNQKEKKI
jgi:uncharacterized protein YacL